VDGRQHGVPFKRPCWALPIIGWAQDRPRELCLGRPGGVGMAMHRQVPGRGRWKQHEISIAPNGLLLGWSGRMRHGVSLSLDLVGRHVVGRILSGRPVGGSLGRHVVGVVPDSRRPVSFFLFFLFPLVLFYPLPRVQVLVRRRAVVWLSTSRLVVEIVTWDWTNIPLTCTLDSVKGEKISTANGTWCYGAQHGRTPQGHPERHVKLQERGLEIYVRSPHALAGQPFVFLLLVWPT
jgi:hypothetical protein